MSYDTKTLKAESTEYTGADPVDADGNFQPEFLEAAKSSFKKALQKIMDGNHTFGFIVTIDPLVGEDGKIDANLPHFTSGVHSSMIAPEIAAKVADDARLSFMSAMSGVPYEEVKRADALVRKLGTQAAIKQTLSKLLGHAMEDLGAEAEQDEDTNSDPVPAELKN